MSRSSKYLTRVRGSFGSKVGALRLVRIGMVKIRFAIRTCGAGCIGGGEGGGEGEGDEDVRVGGSGVWEREGVVRSDVARGLGVGCGAGGSGSGVGLVTIGVLFHAVSGLGLAGTW
jgi:hypothetical protein